MNENINLVILESLNPELAKKIDKAIKNLGSMQVSRSVLISEYGNDKEWWIHLKNDFRGKSLLKRIRELKLNFWSIYGEHFDVTYYQVEKFLPDEKTKVWQQPLIVQRSEQPFFNLPTENVEYFTSDVSGYVIVYRSELLALISVENEPGAPVDKNNHGNEIHPVIKLPYQFGAIHLNKLKGQLPTYSFLTTVTKDESLKPDFKKQAWWSGISDPTRMTGGKVLFSEFILDDEKLKELAEKHNLIVVNKKEAVDLLTSDAPVGPHTVAGLIKFTSGTK